MGRDFNSLVFCAVFCAGVSVAMAAPYVGFSGHYVRPDKGRNAEYKGGSGDVFVGFALNANTYLELRFENEIHDAQDGIEQDNSRIGFGLDVQRLRNLRGEFTAFALVGGGFGKNDAASLPYDENNAFFNLGGGILSPSFFPIGMRARLEARVRYEDYGPGMIDYRVGAGFEFPLADTAADQVEIANAESQPLIAPAHVETAEVRAVAENTFEELNWAPPPTIDELMPRILSCEGDLQECLPEVAVKALKVPPVRFEYASTRLAAESQDTLRTLAGIVTIEPGQTLLIEGYTDSQGQPENNERISRERAEAVVQFLVKQGLDADRVVAIGRGGAKPIADNATAEGRAQNRRIEAYFVR